MLAGCGMLAPANPPVTVEWATASEVNVAGFNVYRGDQPDGPYRQVNPVLIAGSGDAIVGGKYQYLDRDAIPGRTYYYKLEDVDLNGARTLHGPVAARAGESLPVGRISLGVAVLACLAILIALRRRGARV